MLLVIIMNVTLNLASGRRLWRVDAALSGGSKLIFLAWLEPLANVEPGAPRSLRVLGSNDLLAVWIVAVATRCHCKGPYKNT